MKNILYLEDDWHDAESVRVQLAKYGNIQVVSTEHGFRRVIDDIVKSGNWPDLVVLDQRVMWTNPSPVMPESPSEVKQGGFVYAGTRSYHYLRNVQPKSKEIPVIFYSVIDPKQIRLELGANNETPLNYQCVEKDSSYDGLRAAIEGVI